MKIRQTTPSDLNKILAIHKAAFGEQEGPEIAQLVQNLFNDPTALPLYSFVASIEDHLIGHVLFTKVKLIDSPTPVTATILAPLAIKPKYHSKGVGKDLIKEGLITLKNAGVDLVFVLGHPDYYPQSGFKPAGELDFTAPYPIPKKNAGAWMVLELRPGIIGSATGMVQCCEALDKPELWKE